MTPDPDKDVVVFEMNVGGEYFAFALAAILILSYVEFDAFHANLFGTTNKWIPAAWIFGLSVFCTLIFSRMRKTGLKMDATSITYMGFFHTRKLQLDEIEGFKIKRIQQMSGGYKYHDTRLWLIPRSRDVSKMNIQFEDRDVPRFSRLGHASYIRSGRSGVGRKTKSHALGAQLHSRCRSGSVRTLFLKPAFSSNAALMHLRARPRSPSFAS